MNEFTNNPVASGRGDRPAGPAPPDPRDRAVLAAARRLAARHAYPSVARLAAELEMTGYQVRRSRLVLQAAGRWPWDVAINSPEFPRAACRRVLEAAAVIARSDRYPSTVLIGRLLGLNPTTVLYHVRRLRRLGLWPFGYSAGGRGGPLGQEIRSLIVRLNEELPRTRRDRLGRTRPIKAIAAEVERRTGRRVHPGWVAEVLAHPEYRRAVDMAPRTEEGVAEAAARVRAEAEAARAAAGGPETAAEAKRRRKGERRARDVRVYRSAVGRG